MNITAHQPVAGIEPGNSTTVDDEFGAWLIANGYAVETPSDETSSKPKRKGKGGG